jgi:hypothetical protein
MEIKELKYLELEDDREGISTFIQDEAKKEYIDIYVDYRDLEGLESLVRSCDTKWEFCDKIYESYEESINEQQYDIARNISAKLADKYKCDDVSNSLFEYIQEGVWDFTTVNIPYDQFLRQEIKVNIFVTYNNSNDAWEDEFDYTTLTKFITNLGYKKPKTLLKSCMKCSYKGDDKFLKSLQDEFLNAWSSQINLLCFIGKVSIDDFYDIDLSTDKYVSIPKDVTCGFVDPYNGGGSVLAIELPHEYKIRTSDIKLMLIEHSKDAYTVDSIYGLVPEAYKNLKVL